MIYIFLLYLGLKLWYWIMLFGKVCMMDVMIVCLIVFLGWFGCNFLIEILKEMYYLFY